MTRARAFSAILAAGVVIFVAPNAVAQLTDYVWKTTTDIGAQSWQVDGKWNLPNFPNDPGRVDAVQDTVDNSIGANLSIGLTGSLNLDVGGSTVTVASLVMGGTAGAVTTNVSSTGGKLSFENYELNPTAANFDPDVCAFNCGAAQITSGGVAGSINTISAPVQINGERLEISSASTNNLTISGPVTFANLAGTGQSASSIRSFMPSNLKLTISGPVSLVDTATAVGAPLVLNDTGSVAPPPVTPGGTIQSVAALGTIEISGVISDNPMVTRGTLTLGVSSNNVGLSTIILSGANTYGGRTTIQRANLVLANDSALGVDSAPLDDRSGGAVFGEGQAASGSNILSDNDNRTINVSMQNVQNLTITGEHSLTWAGVVTQTNQRSLISMLPSGKKFIITGPQYTNSVNTTDASTNWRIISYDGTGTTEVRGGWHNKIRQGGLITGDETALGHYRKQGSGTVFVNDSAPGATYDFTGDVIVDMGTMHLAKDSIYATARSITSNGGALGVDTGTFGNSNLLNKLALEDNGGLMLTPGEDGSDIDFSIGLLNSNAANMSIAARETGTTYTGKITPATDSFTGVPTYRLGGGGPGNVLTLNDVGSQPTGRLNSARNVQIVNGGEVVLSGANTYSGVTTIQGKYETTFQNQAAANNSSLSSTVVVGTTLNATNLVTGASSSLGSSSNAATNVVVQGGTLKYSGTGSNGTTSRLFTVGTLGATVEAAGSGGSVLNFTNTSPLGVYVAPSRPGSMFQTSAADGVSNGNTNTNNRLQLDHTDDLAVGMPVSGLTIIPAGVNVGAVNLNPSSFGALLPGPSVNITTTIGGGAFESGTISFGNVARTLTLTGENTGNNTMAPQIVDAAAAAVAGGSNAVNVTKSGNGKWILTNSNNTYTGTTNVTAGTLLVNGSNTGNGAYNVSAFATLGGSGSITGAVANSGKIAPGTSPGTLSVTGNVTMAAGSVMEVDLAAGASADKLAITGNLDLSAANNILNVIDTGKTLTSWLIATYTGTLAPSSAFEYVTPGYSVDFSTVGQVTLNFVGGAVAGDYNGDGSVNSADYTVWRDTLGSTFDLRANGDNSNNVIDQADFLVWKNHFNMPPGSGGGGLVGNTTVPEPASFLLASMAIAGLFGFTRRIRSR